MKLLILHCLHQVQQVTKGEVCSFGMDEEVRHNYSWPCGHYLWNSYVIVIRETCVPWVS